MSKKFINSLIFAVITTLSTSYIYASNYSYTKNTPKQETKTSIIRVISTNPKQPNIKLDGSILQSTKDSEATITDIHTTTPWEITVNDDYVRYVLKTSLQNPIIQVQTFEKTKQGNEKRVTANGHVFDGTETNCEDFGCVTSGIIVLN